MVVKKMKKKLRKTGTLLAVFLAMSLFAPLVSAGTNDAKGVAGVGSWVEEIFYFNPGATYAYNGYNTIGFNVGSGIIKKPSLSSFKNYVDYDGSVYFDGHGGYCSGYGYSLWLNDDNPDNDAFDCSGEAFRPSDVPTSTSNLDLAVYNACYSAKGSPSLVSKTKDNGAECAVGWSDTVTLGEGKCFADELFQCLDDENTYISTCVTNAKNSCSTPTPTISSGCGFVLTR